MLPPTESNPPLEGRFIQVAGQRVHYHLIGEGPAVLLLHGNGSLGEEILSPFKDCLSYTWIAPDRPGHGFSEPLETGDEGPAAMANWAHNFLIQLGIEEVTLVAHSISCASACCLAGWAPERLQKLVLLAPFCRPTPHRWMLGLRLAVTPVVGWPIRHYLLPAILPLFRVKILERMLAPQAVPSWLRRFPVEHAAKPHSLKITAAELRRFNYDMERMSPELCIEVPTTAIFGMADETAEPRWHGSWIRQHVRELNVVMLPGVGHLVHHASPTTALNAISSAKTGLSTS